MTIFWWIILAGFLARLAIASILPPGYDEAYYLFYGRNLDFSFFDHPLAVGIWSWIGQRLGDGVLPLRLPSVISYTISLILLGDATKRWYGNSAKTWVAILGSASPLIFACGGILLLPDSPLLLSLSLLLFWLSRTPEATPKNAKEGITLGAILAFLTLSKYHSFIILASLLVISLSSSEGRRAWKRFWPYLSVAVWVALTFPLWIWNHSNHWASFLFQTGRIASDQVFRPDASFMFLLSQIGMLFPTIGLLLVAVIFTTQSRSLKNKRASIQLKILAIPQLILFLILAGRMHVMSSWLVPAWWISLPIAGAWIAARGWSSRTVRIGVISTACVLPPLLAIASLQMRWGILSRWIPAAQDPSTQLINPNELRKALASDQDLLKAVLGADIIASHRYEIPGFFALALPKRANQRFTVLGDDPRGFAFWPGFRTDRSSRGILVAPVEPETKLVDRKFPEMIHNLKSLGTLTIQRSGLPAVELDIASFEAAPGNYPWPYGSTVQK